ncbi:hypothetical protein [Humisphaera borealis]|uniref:Uncharacterized protein n=1 Tax=Humisphaera borealis TaxID=2807512 RepID=A0A7M2X1Q7_9BACT|nr:hypothetical protein [Humisphaera borealis]QOV91071.1 hypothetical protein IPV69_06845 [Humisphaera borealis]
MKETTAHTFVIHGEVAGDGGTAEHVNAAKAVGRRFGIAVESNHVGGITFTDPASPVTRSIQTTKGIMNKGIGYGFSDIGTQIVRAWQGGAQ